ncbi:MAG: ankyrin repeat domain-containing protein [Rhodobacteraceae bacterium]|nr:ankyrin repeat domain-containing protein [Paracoccaceae bacterium]
MTYSLEDLRRRAKLLRRSYLAGDADAHARVSTILPEAESLGHADALHVIAREEGHESWPKLKHAYDIAAMDRNARAERLKMALFFGQPWMVSRLLEADPTLPDHNLGLQIALYRKDAVADALARAPQAATRMIGVRSPILHLAFSQHWRSDPASSADAISIAEMLVAGGADVNDSYPAEPGSPDLLSALYGALGHAGHMPLARWLLEHGANPNDNESLYHATELGHTDGLKLLFEFGAKPEGTNALARAMDFDDIEMVRILLENGADPNEGIAPHPSGQPFTMVPGLHQAARRMCAGDIARLLLEHGAVGTSQHNGHTAYALARMRGNHDVARVLEEAGQATPLDKGEAMLAAIADGEPVGRIDPEVLSPEARLILHRVLGFDGTLPHVKRLIEAGIDPNDVDEQDMPAIHIAGWHGFSDAVAYLLGHNPDLGVKNMYGGNLIDTIIHGSENAPNRASADHIGCARLVLKAGTTLRPSEIRGAGVEEMAALLENWAADHPEKVVEDG